MWLSGGLVAGVLAQAVLGDIVVYTKLNPYVVMVHFFATMLLLVDAVVLVHRSTRDYGAGRRPSLVPRPADSPLLRRPGAPGARHRGRHRHHRCRSARRRRIGTTGGKADSHRACTDMAELHSSLALLLIGVTIGLVVGIHMGDIPERVRRARGSCWS